MQALFLISLGATCLGGAIALGALFHRFLFKSAPVCAYASAARAKSQNSDVSTDSDAKLDELKRRERSFDAMRRRVDDELDAKRQALEILTNRANEAAEALGRALDSFSGAFGANPSPFRTVDVSRACDSVEPFKLNDFDLSSSYLEPTRRADVRALERRTKVA